MKKLLEIFGFGDGSPKRTEPFTMISGRTVPEICQDFELQEEAKTHLADLDVAEIYLDCVYGDGFLPRYYESSGFEPLSRKTIEYPTGLFDMVLMKSLLDPHPRPSLLGNDK